MLHPNQHQHRDTATGLGIAEVMPLLLVGVILLAYLTAVLRQPSDRRRWSGWRTASFVAGAILLAIAVAPPMMRWGHHDLRGHMVQHLLIGMLAPLGLVLAAPVTLAYRTLPIRASRGIATLLRAEPVHWLAHPITALLLNIGGMYALYLTPLYRLTLANPALHHLVHVHFLAAGCLFTWAIAGPDPAPRRPGFAMRVGVLLVGIAAHAYLSKLMYAQLLPANVPHGPEEIRSAAKLMYYGGDFSELLLAIALFAGWYRRRSKRPAPGRSQESAINLASASSRSPLQTSSHRSKTSGMRMA